MVVIKARQHIVLFAAQVEGVGVVALQLRHGAFTDAALGRARQRRGIGDLVQCSDGLAKTDHAGQKIAFVVSTAQAGL